MMISSPGQSNRERFLVLFDCSPDIGALAGCFQIAIGRRTINAFTSDDPIYILKWLLTVNKTLAGLQRKANSRNVHLRACTCLIDRTIGGHTILHDELGFLVSDAYVRELFRKTAGNASVPVTPAQEAARARRADRARQLAMILVNRLPLVARPKDRLLKNENPFQVMRLSGFHWMLSLQSGNTAAVTPDGRAYQDAMASYQGNYAVNGTARNDAWRMGEIIRNAYEDAKPAYIEELKRQREGLTSNLSMDFAPSMGRGAPATIAMRMRGFDFMVDRAFRRAEQQRQSAGGNQPSSYGGCVRQMTVQAYRDGLDLTDPMKVRAYVMGWLRTNLSYDRIKQEVHLPEPSDQYRPYGNTSKDILRLQLFSPVQPPSPQPDSGTIQTLRIY